MKNRGSKMKKYLSLLLVFVMVLSALTGCGTTSENTNVEVTPNESVTTPDNTEETLDETVITLSNSEILVNDVNVLGQKDGAVYAANDIIYYEDGKDFTYGAGTEEDASSKYAFDNVVKVIALVAEYEAKVDEITSEVTYQDK